MRDFGVSWARCHDGASVHFISTCLDIFCHKYRTQIEKKGSAFSHARQNVCATSLVFHDQSAPDPGCAF